MLDGAKDWQACAVRSLLLGPPSVLFPIDLIFV